MLLTEWIISDDYRAKVGFCGSLHRRKGKSTTVAYIVPFLLHLACFALFEKRSAQWLLCDKAMMILCDFTTVVVTLVVWRDTDMMLRSGELSLLIRHDLALARAINRRKNHTALGEDFLILYATTFIVLQPTAIIVVLRREHKLSPTSHLRKIFLLSERLFQDQTKRLFLWHVTGRYWWCSHGLFHHAALGLFLIWTAY